MTHLQLIEAALEIVNYDIENQRRILGGHLSRDYRDRTRLWHKHLYEINEKLDYLLLERAEILVARGRDW